MVQQLPDEPWSHEHYRNQNGFEGEDRRDLSAHRMEQGEQAAK